MKIRSMGWARVAGKKDAREEGQIYQDNGKGEGEWAIWKSSPGYVYVRIIAAIRVRVLVCQNSSCKPHSLAG